MRKRPGHSTQQIDRLRLTIDCLPVATREAMLDGLSSNERIIVGAYVDEEGGVCPMLAAHRCGGRTDFLSFAKSWDRFTRAAGRSRRATRRELDVLVNLLEDSLMREGDMDLARAIEQHRELRGRSERERDALAQTVDPAGEIRAGRLGSARALRFLGRGVGAGERRTPAGAGLVAGLSEQ
jgi:hypothetical protein